MTFESPAYEVALFFKTTHSAKTLLRTSTETTHQKTGLVNTVQGPNSVNEAYLRLQSEQRIKQFDSRKPCIAKKG